ncbi:MAG: Holliday junction resolvase RuvX [Anaerolineaceae bacterium]|jgi:putative Holliday junction resolvase
MKYLGIDHGNARIGIAVSDPTGTLARPFQILKHTSRAADALFVAKLAALEGCETVIVGLPLDSDGSLGPRARSVNRFIDELRIQTELPVIAWDESHSTKEAVQASILRGEGKKKRQNAIDDQAAAIILQDYLDNHPSMNCDGVNS